jgi:hypothetical protein
VLAHGKDIANLREGLCIRLRRQLPTACCGLSRRIKFLHIDPDELARAQPRPPMVPGGVGSVGNHTAETDCVPGHVRFELRNVAANYPFERVAQIRGDPAEFWRQRLFAFELRRWDRARPCSGGG